MTVEDGVKTQLQKGQASAAARLDMLDERVEILEAMRERIAALEALRGIEAKPAASFWNSVNGRWLIASITITLLALLGWNADDLRNLIP